TMVVADPGRIDAVESVPVRFPEFFETCIAKRAQQTLLQVIRLIVAGVDIEIGSNDRADLQIRAPVIRLGKRFQLSMVGVENLEPATAKRGNGPGSLLFHRRKNRLVIGVVFCAAVADNTGRNLDAIDPAPLQPPDKLVNMAA